MLNGAVDTYSDVRVVREQLLPFISNCYRPAVRKLTRYYEEFQPAAILVGEDRLGTTQVVDNFLDTVEDGTVIARIDNPCTDATAFMQEVIRSVGFKPNDMSLGDLEKVLQLFLQYQRTHKIRTIISVQHSSAQGWWVLDKVRRLVELEAQERYGLLVILSGPPDIVSVLNEPILDIVLSQAGERIVLTPFTLVETRRFIRQLVENIDPPERKVDDISQVFEFLAVTLIHDICSGVPDNIGLLSSKCLELFDQSDDERISTDTVRKAAALVELLPMLTDDQAASPSANGGADVLQPGRLLVETSGEEAYETALDQKCFVIGRDQLCNVCIHGLRVSRFHAVVSMSQQGVHIADLGSTNGTTVNGKKVKRAELRDKDMVTIGTTRITYLAGGAQLTAEPDIESTDAFEFADQEPEPCITYLGNDMHLLRTS